MKKLNIGIIAHVDSGKTTLSEALLYLTGSIRNLGRVDKGSSFLDDNEIERRRGITVFSKIARFSSGNTEFTLIDTPGHADFSAETERALQVLDYAVLVISASDGIKGQTLFLWNMLENAGVPVFIFVNKMDQDGADKQAVLEQIRSSLSDSASDMSAEGDDVFFEHAAQCSNEALEEYFASGTVSEETLRIMIRKRELFPCLFGSALKLEGIEELLSALDRYTLSPAYPENFSARVYKIGRDESGTRLTFLKVTGGTLKNKSSLPDGENESKINEIRIYSGNKYTLKDEASAGDICVLTGLRNSYAGQVFGDGLTAPELLSASVLSYRVIPPEGMDPAQILPAFKTLDEESPELSVGWDSEKQELKCSVLGEVQLEILKSLLEERFGLEVGFDSGEVLYKETVNSVSVGVGHFEPLRHYAEVHLLLEPGERGSGIIIDSALSTDDLAKNWQSQILNALKDCSMRGVLTGSPVTDLHVSLISGRANIKHSDGGDFREATLRAFRQGLMMAENALLEPYYRFILDIPSDQAGRALNDLSLMGADFSSPENNIRTGRCIISGRAPVRKIMSYPLQVNAYSRGEGSISFISDGYDICTDSEDIISTKAYDPERDTAFPSGSIFCSHGAGYYVPYDQVYSQAHLPVFNPQTGGEESKSHPALRKESDIALGTSDIEKIIAGYSLANSKDKKNGGKWKRKMGSSSPAVSVSPLPKKLPAPFSIEKADILLADGYNIIFAWEDLADLAHENIDAARDALIEILNKYASMVETEVTAVFDAYRVEGHASEQMTVGKVKVVFTSENEIADQYIEKFTTSNAGKRKIAVVTSDRVEQVITLGQGCRVVSSREFRNHFENLTAAFNEQHNIG